MYIDIKQVTNKPLNPLLAVDMADFFRAIHFTDSSKLGTSFDLCFNLEVIKQNTSFLADTSWSLLQ